MKIIFLDIDGVLNNQLWYIKTKGKRHSRFNIDPENIKMLNSIIKATKAKVVITSTWRHGQTKASLQRMLKSFGFKGKIIGITTDMRYTQFGTSILRGNEILHWIQTHEKDIEAEYYEYKNYVILDDDSDMLYWQRNNYLKVDAYCGLTPNVAFHAIKILNQ